MRVLAYGYPPGFHIRPYAFGWEPLFLALAVAAAVVYWRAARRDSPGGWRVASFAAGLLLIAASLNSPLENLAAHYLLLMHLLQNALIADVAPLLVDPGSHKRLTVGGRVALAVALFAGGQILTDVLVFSFTPLYPSYHGAYGLSALADQQVAGLVMMVEQLLTLGTCVALLLRPRWLPRSRVATA